MVLLKKAFRVYVCLSVFKLVQVCLKRNEESAIVVIDETNFLLQLSVPVQSVVVVEGTIVVFSTPRIPNPQQSIPCHNKCIKYSVYMIFC